MLLKYRYYANSKFTSTKSYNLIAIIGKHIYKIIYNIAFEYSWKCIRKKKKNYNRKLNFCLAQCRSAHTGCSYIGCRSVSICWAAKLGAYRCRSCVRRSTLNMLIVHKFVCEFCLSLTQTNRIRVSVYRMNLRKQHNIAGRTYGKGNGDNQQEQSDNNTGCRIIELTDCCDKATVTRSGNSNGLHNQNDHLKKENEEKHHEIEAGIATERLVRRPIPVKSEIICIVYLWMN